MIREFVFLKSTAELGEADVSPYVADPSESCISIFVNRVEPPIEGFTPEPLWTLVLEAAYDTDAPPARSAFTLDLRRAERSMAFLARQHIVFDGPRRGLKILSMPRRKEGMTPEAFSQHYRRVHGALVAACPPFREHLNCYVQHHVIPGTVSTTGEAPAPCDGISEFRADNVDRALAAWKSPEYFEMVKPDEANFVFLRPEASTFADRKSHKLTVVENGLYSRSVVAG